MAVPTMLRCLVNCPIRVFGLSYFLWLILSSVIPQLTSEVASKDHTISNIPPSLANKEIYFVIAHPDDEVMFFSPTIIELGKPRYGNTLNLLCLSSGNAANLGSIRSEELYDSSNILGIAKENVHIIDDEVNFMDSMAVTWEADKVSEAVSRLTPKNPKVFITFDDGGVSHHANHISLYRGMLQYKEENKGDIFYKLKTFGVIQKYSFVIKSNCELLIRYASKWEKIFNLLQGFETVQQIMNADSYSPVKVYSNFNMLATSVAAMSFGHFSQMVWFRYGWLILSRYLTYNELERI